MKLEITKNGRSKYRIIIASKPTPELVAAAADLKSYVKQATGASLPIKHINKSTSEYEIVLGNHSLLKELGVQVDQKTDDGDGYIFRTVGKTVIIASNNKVGARHAVCCFLENYLCIRWLTVDETIIPSYKVFLLPALNKSYTPQIIRRTLFWGPRGEWTVRARVTVTKGDYWKYYPIRGIHNFTVFVPIEKYFKKHPEYFSEQLGERQKTDTQLCLSNPTVRRIAVDRAVQIVKKGPGRILGLSQDDNETCCRCKKCIALTRKLGSDSDVYLDFINEVAAAIYKVNPAAMVETLAYNFTRPAPKMVKPLDNVIVRFCTIECCFLHSITNCRNEHNVAIKKDIIAWGKITKNLSLYGYVINFVHYLMPFPNLETFQDNIRFYVKNNVTQAYESGLIEEKSEMNYLKSYILAKLLWDPSLNYRDLLLEFLQGYFKKAWIPVRKYIDLLHENVRKNKDVHAGIYAHHDSGFLPKLAIKKAEKLFKQAALLADNKIIACRVELASMPVLYAKILLMDEESNRDDQAIEIMKLLKLRVKYNIPRENVWVYNKFSDLYRFLAESVWKNIQYSRKERDAMMKSFQSKS